jgi:hypothetical protein
MSEHDSVQEPPPAPASPAPPAPLVDVEAPAPPTPWPRVLGWAALIGVPILWTAVVWIQEAARIPADADRTQAARAVHEGWQEGDALAIAPPWALRNLAVLGDLEPTFDPQLAERPPDARRLWVVAEREGEPTLEALARRFPLELREEHGRMSVARFGLGQQRGFHVVDHLARARVSIEGKGPAVPCDRWRAERWDCQGRPDWQHVSAEFLDVDMAPRRALWAHPPPAGETLWLRFPGVTLGRELELWGGHTVHGAQSAKAAVQVRALLDGQPLGSASFPPAYPMRGKRLDTSALAGRTGELALAIDTPDNGANHFCVDAVIAAPAASP